MAKKRRSWKTTLWETVECEETDCWCMGIKAETGYEVQQHGWMPRGLATLVVKEHNELLESKLAKKEVG
jgi:hypothetical protein